MAKTAISLPGVVGVAMAVVLASCAGLRAPEPERRPAVARAWDVPPSVITVPIRVGPSEARAWTESLVPETLKGEGSGQRTLTAWFLKHDWHFWWTYTLKRSPLSLAFEDNRIRVGARLTGDLSARWDTLPGEVSSQVEADGGVESVLSLGQDWRLRSESSVFLDVRRASVPVGITWDGVFFGETINIAGPVQAALAPSLEGLSREVDRRLAAWDLRPEVEASWRGLQEPRLVADSPPLWFRLAPHGVAAGPVRAGSDGLELPLTLTVTPSLTSGSRPAASTLPLPKPTQDSGPPGFVVNLPISLGWDEAAALTKDLWLRKTPWDVGNGAKVRITGLQASTDADRVLLRVEALLTPPWPGPEIPAVLWFGAVPVWDPESRTLRLTQTTLDVRTRDYLAAAASWLLGGPWWGDLEAALRWDLGPRLDDWQHRVSASLGAVDLGPHLTLSAHWDGLQIVDWALTDTGIAVLARVTGQASVNVKP